MFKNILIKCLKFNKYLYKSSQIDLNLLWSRNYRKVINKIKITFVVVVLSPLLNKRARKEKGNSLAKEDKQN